MTGRIKSKHQLVANLEGEMVRRVRKRGGLSRVQLARELKLAPSTAGIYVDRLVREGYLLENAPAGRPLAGRPPTALVPNPGVGRFVGVDFEARNVMATDVDFSQRPLHRVHRVLRPGDPAAQVLAKIEEAIDEVAAADPRPLLGIGVGVPGSIDPVTKVAVDYPFIPGWNNVALGERLSRRFGVPLALENNIRSMAMAELWFGAGRGLRNFVCVGIRSGIAAGVLVNGVLLRGARHRAGEIGHWVCPVPAELVGDDRPAGRNGPWRWQAEARLEHVASLSALVVAAQRALKAGCKSSLAGIEGALAIDDVLAAARDGDELALSVVRAAGRVHGWVAHQLNELFNPEKIIFAGPLADLGEPFLTPLREAACGFSEAGGEPAVVSSTLGQFSGAIGAAALAMHEWKPKR